MSGETILNGRYKLVSQQGSGGMAVIYKAVDMSLGRTVAIKILRPSLTTDPSFIVRFQNEARSIANLQHPNIVTVHDVGSEGQTHYMVMEFVEGQDLKKIIKAHSALPVDRALHLAIGICAGIGFAHRAGIVHADIKPQNVLVTKDDIVKMTDFGIAQALSDTQPTQRQSVVWGSPHYFAPEQAKGERPTAAADVYAIGIVIFEMLTGRLPYIGTNQQELALAHIRERIPMVTEFNPGVPEALAKIIFKTMSKEPSQRFRMADQLGHILISYRDRGREGTVSGAGVEDQPAPASAPVPPPQAMPTVQRPTYTLPAPPLSQPIRPQTPPPAMPPEAVPTQRYSVAPGAPSQPGYGHAKPSGVPSDSRSFQAQQYTGTSIGVKQPPPLRGDSGAYKPRAPYGRQEEESFQLDGVTIALAIIAFLAVACLIPLYIVALQAQMGG